MNLKDFWILAAKPFPPFRVYFTNGISMPITIVAVKIHPEENIWMYHRESGDWFEASRLDNIEAIETLEEE